MNYIEYNVTCSIKITPRINTRFSYVYLGHVGYGNVPRFSAHADGEVGFERRFIKTREGGSSMCRLKLSGRHHPVGKKI